MFLFVFGLFLNVFPCSNDFPITFMFMGLLNCSREHTQTILEFHFPRGCCEVGRLLLFFYGVVPLPPSLFPVLTISPITFML